MYEVGDIRYVVCFHCKYKSRNQNHRVFHVDTGWPWLTTRTPLLMDLRIEGAMERERERERERQAVRQKKQIGKNKIARWTVTETEKYIIGKQTARELHKQRHGKTCK